MHNRLLNSCWVINCCHLKTISECSENVHSTHNEKIVIILPFIHIGPHLWNGILLEIAANVEIGALPGLVGATNSALQSAAEACGLPYCYAEGVLYEAFTTIFLIIFNRFQKMIATTVNTTTAASTMQQHRLVRWLKKKKQSKGGQGVLF